MNKQLIRIFVTAGLLLCVWLTTKHFELVLWQQLLLYLIPYLLISYDVIGEAAEGIAEGDPFDENFLMVIATAGALAIGFLPGADSQFAEAVFVMLFFQVGEYFEDYAEDKSKDSISSMMDLRPDSANVERDGKIYEVDPNEVKVNDIVVVRPGEKIPLDGVIVEGNSSLNTVALTGESMPRDAKPGDNVASGCVNISGILRVKVAKPFGESTAAKILSLVENAGSNKSKSESFITRFAHVYTPIVVGLALVFAFIPPLLSSGSYLSAFPTWLYRALTFLIVSCPCALVISVPLTFFGGIGGASRLGILIKGGRFMDVLSKLNTVVFDKTGTLTNGVFKVDAVHPEMISEQELLHLAAHVERFSTHPIAAALRAAYPDIQDGCSVEDIEEVAGQGIRAVVNGHKACVGNERMMNSVGAEVHHCSKCDSIVGTIIHVSLDGIYAGHIVIADQVKPDAQSAVSELKKLGVEHTVMLTGDKRNVAAFVAEKLGLDEWHAELLPDEKVRQVERLIKEEAKGTLAFVGDGINDAPVLARADVGIAMGALGSDAAIEAADVVLMDDKPSKIARAVKLSRRTIRIAGQNAWFAILVKVLVLVLAAFGLANMGMAVFADVGVMILCVLNSTRALQIKNI